MTISQQIKKEEIFLNLYEAACFGLGIIASADWFKEQ